jgi:hypothetical protein
MVPRLVHLAWLAAAFAAAGAAPPAVASTVIGTPDPGVAPDGFLCDGGCGDAALGVRQLTLGGEPIVADEGGVITSAEAHAVRLGDGDDPRIAVVRNAPGGQMTVVDSAPLPVDATAPGDVADASGLRLAVQPGDSIGFLFRPEEVDLGIRDYPGAGFVRFPAQCAVCAATPGADQELLFNATVEPDADGDGLGDESEDPDGGAGEAGTATPDLTGDATDGRRAKVRVLRVRYLPKGGAILTLRVPEAGRLSAVATGRTPRGEPLVVARGQARATGSGRVRLILRPSRAGHALLGRVPHVDARVRLSFRPESGRASRLTRELRLHHFRLHHHHGH